MAWTFSWSLPGVRRANLASALNADHAARTAATSRDGNDGIIAIRASVRAGTIEQIPRRRRHARRRRNRRQATARGVRILRPIRADPCVGQRQLDASVWRIKTNLGRQADRISASERPCLRLAIRRIRAAAGNGRARCGAATASDRQCGDGKRRDEERGAGHRSFAGRGRGHGGQTSGLHAQCRAFGS